MERLIGAMIQYFKSGKRKLEVAGEIIQEMRFRRGFKQDLVGPILK